MKPLPVISRRRLLQRTACGFGALALHDIARAASDPLAARLPGAVPRAKRVIFLFMAGGPSQMDLFDPKEFIAIRHGQKIDSPLRKEVTQVGTEKFLALQAMAPVKPRGESGTMISDLMPHLASVADDLCLLRGMSADNPQHAGATLQFHTGTFAEVRPSMGAWVSYGLGTENANLPSFVSIHGGGVREFGAAFLPAIHQGTRLAVPLDAKALPIDNLGNVSENTEVQERRLGFIQKLNRRLLEEVNGDPAMEGMIGNMELAARMQLATPGIVDLSKEGRATLDLYGVGGKDTDKNARACLLARKLSESGVRFVTINTFLTVFNELTWDIHGSKPFTSIEGMKNIVAPMYDQAYSALIEDLSQRGMLDDTLVCNVAEFGRTPKVNPAGGRDHWPQCFTCYFAGGGVQGGRAIGASDPMGGVPADRPADPATIAATIFHSLGFDLKTHLPGPAGRPFPLVDSGKHEIHELF